MIKHYLPHLIFFAVFFTAAIPVLYYLRRKHPDPRFRPSFGEMSLLTVIALFICGCMAMALGSLFKPENDGSAFKMKPFDGPGPVGEGSEQGGGSDGRRSQDKGSKGESPRRTNDRK